jgi:hypothetical protein
MFLFFYFQQEIDAAVNKAKIILPISLFVRICLDSCALGFNSKKWRAHHKVSRREPPHKTRINKTARIPKGK